MAPQRYKHRVRSELYLLHLDTQVLKLYSETLESHKILARQLYLPQLVPCFPVMKMSLEASRLAWGPGVTID